MKPFSLLLVLVLGFGEAIPEGPLAPVPVAHERAKYLGAFHFGPARFGVTTLTVTTLDGVATPYLDIPDESTELVEISLDLKRKWVLRMVYITKRET